MRLITSAAAAGLLALFATLFAVFAPVARAATLVVAGSSTVAPALTDIAHRLESDHPGISIEVRTLGSGPGVAELRAGRCDIAMISRPVAGNERDLFAFPLARDGAAIVVHRSNPARNITSGQLRDLLTGKITNWKQLGGRDTPIRVAWRSEGQGIPELLLQQLKLKHGQIRSHAMFFENADAVKYAAEHQDAVAFASVGVAERLVRSGMPVKLLAYEDVPANNRSLRDHTYPLSRPLILLTRSVPTGLQKQLIDYATSSAATDVLEKHGHVPYR